MALEERPQILMASHSTSSSHTVMDKNTDLNFVFKALPSATSVYKLVDDYEPYIVLSPSSGFEVDQLLKEIKEFGVPKYKIIVPYRAYVVEQRHKEKELTAMGGVNHLGSTLSGQSQAFCDKVSRKKGYRLAGDYDEIKEVATVMDYPEYSEFIKNILDDGGTALCELPQGFPLSLNYSNEIGKSTYRDVNPLEVQSAIGLNVKYFGKVIGNMRLYPIRVSNRFTNNDAGSVKLKVCDNINGVIVDECTYSVKAEDIGMDYDTLNSMAQDLKDGTSLKYSHKGKEYIIVSIEQGLEGTSGSFEKDMYEITWNYLSYFHECDFSEITTLTKLPRRIAIPDNGLLSIDLLKKADMTIGVDYLSITFVNYDIEKRSVFQIESDLKSMLHDELPNIKLVSIQNGKYVDDVHVLK